MFRKMFRRIFEVNSIFLTFIKFWIYEIFIYICNFESSKLQEFTSKKIKKIKFAFRYLSQCSMCFKQCQYHILGDKIMQYLITTIMNKCH